MSETCTIEGLQALSDDDLNALAAGLRGAVKIDWNPATDRNQSSKLLEWAVAQGCAFDVQIGRNSAIGVFVPPNATHFPDAEIPGNTARAETIAFCAAMLAMAGRLK